MEGRFKRFAGWLLALVFFAAPFDAGTQSAKRPPTVGILTVLPLSSITFTRYFPQALKELGYAEEKDILLVWRSAEGNAGLLGELASELVRAKVDVIVAIANPDVMAAKQATSSVPIVMVAGIEPIGAGLVASLARSGNNVTGRTWHMPPGKSLELLKDVTPSASRVAYFRGASVPGYPTYVRDARAGAKALGLSLHVVEVRPSDDISGILDSIRRWQPDALFVGPAGITAEQRDAIRDFALRHRLPTVYTIRGMVEAGGLMAYQPSTLEAAHRTAYFVQRILNGAKPADLPIEEPQRFELILNLRTARQIGLQIPPAVLLRADEVIE